MKINIADYRYRWLIAVLGMLAMLVAGYLTDIQIIMHDHEQLLASEDDIRQQINFYQQQEKITPYKKQHPFIMANKSKLLDEVLQVIDKYNINLTSAMKNTFDQQGLQDAEYYQLNFTTHTVELFSFLQSLASGGKKYAVRSFTLSAAENDWLQVELFLRIRSVKATPKVMHPVRSFSTPFCHGGSSIIIF